MKELILKSNSGQMWSCLLDVYKHLKKRNVTSGMRSVPVTMIPHTDAKLIKAESIEADNSPWLP